MQKNRVIIYFDYYSPYAYFVSTAFDRIATRYSLTAEWRPLDAVQLLRLAEGDIYSPAKRRYVNHDVFRCADYYATPIALPSPWPINARPALAASLVAQEAGIFEPFRKAVFNAAWAQQRDIADTAVLAECVAQAGGDADQILRRAGDARYAQAIVQHTERAAAEGVFGVPLMIYDDERFFGRDRLAMLEWRLQRPGTVAGSA
jgi:2-hydroxychromene-2-carboxylate isomerase